MAKQLKKLGVDVIEAGFPIASPGDFDAVARIAQTVGNGDNPPIICGLARALKGDIKVRKGGKEGAGSWGWLRRLRVSCVCAAVAVGSRVCVSWDIVMSCVDVLGRGAARGLPAHPHLHRHVGHPPQAQAQEDARGGRPTHTTLTHTTHRRHAEESGHRWIPFNTTQHS